MYQMTRTGMIRRLSDNACIPADPGNTDYQAFLAWIAKGNLAEPAPLPDPKEAIRTEIEAIERVTGVVRLVREGLMRAAERAAKEDADALTATGSPTTPEQILAQNIGYMRAKAVDDHIVQLRGMLA